MFRFPLGRRAEQYMSTYSWRIIPRAREALALERVADVGISGDSPTDGDDSFFFFFAYMLKAAIEKG